MSEQSLNRSDIDTAVEQMGRKAVAQRMEGDLLLDPGRLDRFVEQASDLPRRQWPPLAPAWEQPALSSRYAGIVLGCANLPPFAQQIERLRREELRPKVGDGVNR